VIRSLCCEGLRQGVAHALLLVDGLTGNNPKSTDRPSGAEKPACAMLKGTITQLQSRLSGTPGLFYRHSIHILLPSIPAAHIIFKKRTRSSTCRRDEFVQLTACCACVILLASR
jgi:hypothetical protein